MQMQPLNISWFWLVIVLVYQNNNAINPHKSHFTTLYAIDLVQSPLIFFVKKILWYTGSTDCFFSFPAETSLNIRHMCHYGINVKFVTIVLCAVETSPSVHAGLKSFRWLSGRANWKDRLQTRLYHWVVHCLNLQPFIEWH